ncbi:hypothetical protein [Fannyhessea vaginae]|uniref:hypothetical protein n=1 Tax=Fannyhessea vaginae TaxID=82135 RepID=UPI003983D34F
MRVLNVLCGDTCTPPAARGTDPPISNVNFFERLPSTINTTRNAIRRQARTITMRPTTLISPTRAAYSDFCERRAVLNANEACEQPCAFLKR